LFYIGLSQPIEGLTHHTLFFDEDFGLHAEEIYTHPQWPSKPLFYTSLASKTDPGVAPAGMENLVILVPLAPGLEDTEELREKYYHLIMDRFERLTGQAIRSHVVYRKSYAHRDFVKDYHSFKGNAYGLANTLTQTALLKPVFLWAVNRTRPRGSPLVDFGPGGGRGTHERTSPEGLIQTIGFFFCFTKTDQNDASASKCPSLQSNYRYDGIVPRNQLRYLQADYPAIQHFFFAGYFGFSALLSGSDLFHLRICSVCR
jgi:hypothetical protein